MDFGDLQDLQASYRREASDLLADLGDALLLLEQTPADMELVNRVFRAMHTIKGSGATAGYRRLTNFVHHVEEVFNRIRNGQLASSPELIDAALKACDCCAILLRLDSEDTATPVPLETEVLAAIQAYLPDLGGRPSKTKSASAAAGPRAYTVGFRPNREIFFSGTDPASLLAELAELGTLQVRCDTSLLLESEAFDPEQCYLSWNATLESSAGENAVRSVFQFVEDDCSVSIEAAPLSPATPAEPKQQRSREAATQALEAIRSGLEQCRREDEKAGLSTIKRGANTLRAAGTAHAHLPTTRAAAPFLESVKAARSGSIVDAGWLARLETLLRAAEQAVSSPDPQATTAVQVEVPKASEPAPAESVQQSIRVDSAKLDALMRLAGELLVARGALPAFAERLERGELPKALANEMRAAGAKVSRVAEDLQATVMSIRMLPVRQVFGRFPRLVRDIGRTLDKHIELHVSGEDTELDKTVIESLGDPLTHIIRNAADHGIESKEERLLAGKPAAGRIDLSAFTRGSNVVIEIRDDGKGLDATKLKKRALDKGLYSEAALDAMDEEAAFRIIMAAGFSTAETVTDLSGRGVGMDVVRNSVEALHGTIQIRSDLGKGTCFRIELPASLLVSKGILVALSGEQLVLPMESIVTMVKIPTGDIRCVQGGKFAHVRGTVYPLVHLAQALAFSEGAGSQEPQAVAILNSASGPYGLIVDRFLGEVEIVVKSLTGVLAGVPDYVGAAIMGDGRTVLVVNTERLSVARQP